MAGRPLIEFETEGTVPVLRYDVPSPSSYEGRNLIEIALPPRCFLPAALTGRPTLKEFIKANREALREYLGQVSLEELIGHLYVYGIDAAVSDEDPHTGPIPNPPDYLQSFSKEKMYIPYEVRLEDDKIDSVKDGRPTNKDIGTVVVYNTTAVQKQKPSVGGGQVPALKLQTESSSQEAEEGDSSGEEEAKVYTDDLPGRYAFFVDYTTHVYNQVNLFPCLRRTMSGRIRPRYVDVPDEARPRLIFVETYRLTTYPGDYGAGTVVKTFSLLPGEETDISVKTWKRTTESRREASSVMDSYTEEKADQFEQGIQSENSSRSELKESDSYHIDTEAKAGWGWGSADVKAGIAGSTDSCREEFAKNVSNATESHAQTASAKREVNVETSYESTTEAGTETAIMRRVKNLNVGRTLNFVFRQMNQEFHSLLHLTDLRVAFYNGFPGSMREYALHELDRLMESYLDEEALKEECGTSDGGSPLEDLVYREYGPDTVVDWTRSRRQLVEWSDTASADSALANSYLRVRNDTQTYTGDAGAGAPDAGSMAGGREVRGVITAARRFSMKTDGVVVEALLGQAPALDEYALGSQMALLKKRQVNADRLATGLQIIEALQGKGQLGDAIDAYTKLFPVQENASKEEDRVG